MAIEALRSHLAFIAPMSESRFTLALTGASMRGRKPSSSAVPLDRSPQPLLERRLGDEAEARGGARRIQHPSRLSIRLGRIPDDAPLEPCQLGDQADQVLDRDLLPRPHVDRLGT